jgi:hypothetical protein
MPDRLSTLVESLPQVWIQVQAELGAFADFIEATDNEPLGDE